MDEGRSEVLGFVRIWVAVLTIREVALYHCAVRGIVYEATSEAVQGRHELRDAGRNNDTTGTQDTVGFCQGNGSLVAFRQVIERAEQQDRVDAGIVLGEMTGITHFAAGKGMIRLQRRCLFRPFNMEIDGIDKMRGIAQRGEPAGV